jgi:hypothetical protein
MNDGGKSSLISSILCGETISKTNNLHMPTLRDIGYLDQHYSTFNLNK